MSDVTQRERQEFGLDLSEVRHEPLASRWALKLYVAVLALFPFALVIFAFWWMTSDMYLRHMPYAYLVDTGYGSTLHGADCQVVIDGDSTALVGVMPKVIEQRTGLKTCNIAEVAGIKLVNGMMVLDDYLAQNRPPRYLVFLFAPENLTPPQEWTSVGNFEGWFYRIRFHRDAGFWHMALHEPNVLVTVVELGFRNGAQWLFKRPLPSELAHERELTGGRAAEPGAPLKSCAGDTIVRAPDKTWLSQLRHTYGVHGTQVLVDVTPMPTCDVGLEFYRAHLPGVVDNTVDTLPVGDFNSSGRLHMTDDGATELSKRVADQIAARLQTTPSSPASQQVNARGGR